MSPSYRHEDHNRSLSITPDFSRVLLRFIGLPAVLTVFLASNLSVWAAVYSVNSAIPDNSTIGVTDARTVSGLDTHITSISVSVDISGGFNGDLYGYLRLNDSPLVILLNRSGMTGSNPDGYANNGFNITFTGSPSANDIHFYQNYSPSYNGSGQLTGTWQADGRSNPLDTTRNSSLNDFLGLNPNGTWTLFFADRSAGDESTLVSWSLDLLTEVPEPTNIALGMFAGLAAIAGFGRPLLRRVRFCGRV